MSYKVILYTEKKIANRLCDYSISNSTDFEIVYISESYKQCIDKLIQLQENVVIIFQMFHPIYNVQDFFSDLMELNLSPLLIAFSPISNNEVVYSMTSHKESNIFYTLQDFFTGALKNIYTCYFNCISDNKDSNIVMTSRIKQLEKTEYLKDILRGVTEKEFIYYKHKVKLNLKDTGYYLYLWNLWDIEYPDHDLNKNIYYLVGEILLQECQEVLNSYNGGEAFYINPTMVCIIVNHLPSNSQATNQQVVKERVRKLNRVLNCKTSFRYESKFIKNIKEIREAYEEYHNLKIYNYFCLEAELLTFEYINNAKKEVDYESINKLLAKIKEIILRDISDSTLIPLIKSLFIDYIKPSLSYNLYFYCHTYLIAAIEEKYKAYYKNMIPINYSPQKLFFSSIEQQCNDFIESIYLLKGELSTSYMVKSPIVLNSINFIHNNYKLDLSISLIAENLNISHAYLTQAFTKEMGINPKKYLITYRIQKAKELILSSDEPVYSIALTVGFTDVKHFSKTFRKITGLTPSQYKKQHMEVEFVK